ncbi:hypothetical protein ANN_11755 [Periplaneta americana]|uniref:Mariner Mos1 transposase n=1 Tax=Periplaneta americana TaxID=6978 RepID=A0ABQ8T5X6_PERAM|nr:hypothetical protein ANN_11755 [Periplaneta americana]
MSAEQKETRMTLAGDMISMADEDVPKRQSSEWKSKTSPRMQKFPRDTSKGKVMLEVFFDSQGLIYHEFIPEGRTVTKELYVEILRRLRDAVRRKRPEKWVENNWFLRRDNAPAHRAIIVKNFLARHNITALDHPPYSPDLSPPDYFLFPRLKSHLKGRRFNAEEVIVNATRALRRVSQNGFLACFQELYTRWQNGCGRELVLDAVMVLLVVMIVLVMFVLDVVMVLVVIMVVVIFLLVADVIEVHMLSVVTVIVVVVMIVIVQFSLVLVVDMVVILG